MTSKIKSHRSTGPDVAYWKEEQDKSEWKMLTPLGMNTERCTTISQLGRLQRLWLILSAKSAS